VLSIISKKFGADFSKFNWRTTFPRISNVKVEIFVSSNYEEADRIVVVDNRS